MSTDARDAADPKKVTSAHRKVMLRNHPDRGGSPLIATKINEAKDLIGNAKLSPSAAPAAQREETSAQRAASQRRRAHRKRGRGPKFS